MEEELYGNPYDNEKKQELLTRLQKVFKDGYRPTRGIESYSVMAGNYVKAFQMINCFGHIFNLRNKQLDDYAIVPYRTFSYFPNMSHESNDHAKQRIFDFIKDVGLQLEACDPSKPIEDFKSWKVALYFDDNPYSKDFHFLLEEAPQIWSSKVGYTSYLEHIYTKEPPMQYAPIADNRYVYKFYDTYKITNPNANENNPYIKGWNLPIIPSEHKLKHCLIEGKTEDNYLTNYEPILLL